MLDRSLLVRDLILLGEKIFSLEPKEFLFTYDEWKKIVTNQLFLSMIEDMRQSQSLVGWTGCLSEIFSIDEKIDSYDVLAVDGSQIYPDRHLSGVGCYLLNAGGCLLSYGKSGKAQLFSHPRVCVSSDDDQSFALDLVDLEREAYEFEFLIERASLWKKNIERNQFVCLIDGSLIFWHLESKSPELRNRFLSIYLDFLSQCKELNIIVAGYLSLPNNKELVRLIEAGLCSYEAFSSSGLVDFQKSYCSLFDVLTDVQLVKSFLPQYSRTTLLHSSSNIVQAYPSVIKPQFFYLNVGKEIARVEIHAWIAQQPELVDFVARVCIDQSIKGQGYPVALSESHEQAVIKSPDRDFFYHMIHKIGLEGKRRIFLSQKSLKKRTMGL